MLDDSITQELVQQMERLKPEQQQQVLEYARTLSSTPPGTPGRELLRFFGTLSRDDGDAMLEVIERDLEVVDPNEW